MSEMDAGVHECFDRIRLGLWHQQLQTNRPSLLGRAGSPCRDWMAKTSTAALGLVVKKKF
jgi:hypothetical protein